MGIRSFLSKPFASYIMKQQKAWSASPGESQEKVFNNLIATGRNTPFGKDHGLDEVTAYDEFKQAIPIRDYEKLKPYIQRIISGEQNVLWKGAPLYLAKTSGTTSGTKYIPVTKDSVSNHIKSASDVLLSYIHETGNA